ncbi:IS3 family transposase [Lentibacillus saliphilus]|uniref:IS3 family transposase n=1 Tax=Lentibacillus saliphilus TaxID=2737028 RepID=UPI001C2FDEFB
MCDVFNIPKSTYYYHDYLTCKSAQEEEDKELSKEIARIFKESRNNYGTRKIKKELAQLSESNWSINERNGPVMRPSEKRVKASSIV